MMLFQKEFLQELLSAEQKPCLSLYQPTHRSFPSNQQDPIRFGNLMKELEASLRQNFPKEKANTLLEPFKELAANLDFWNNTLDGLAVFASPQLFRVYRLQRSMPERAIVAENFHTKPLQRYLQTKDRFQVLGLSLQEVFFYEGNRDSLDKVELPAGVPGNIKDALGSELTEEHLTVASYGGTGPQGTNMRHGHGSKKDEIDVDAERFFRAVDRAILNQCSKPSGLPLILAALPEHHNLFQKVSHNPFLIKEGIKINPESQSTDQLRKLAWQVWRPQYLENLKELASQYQQMKGHNSGTDDLGEIAKSGAAGRVKTLLVEENKVIPGKIIDDHGEIRKDDLHKPDVDDLLDDLGELVLKMGGEVWIMPQEFMPTKTGAAAIYRY